LLTTLPGQTFLFEATMKKLSKYFFRGLITILPLALTLYLLFVMLAWMETVALWILRPLFGDFYIPGMGLVVGMLGIVLIGYLVSNPRVRKALLLVELPFTNLPVVKSIYSSLKSFADYFSPTGKQGEQSVVILRMPDNGLEIVGLITRRSFADLPAGFLPGERVAVYLPMGYMIGGYTVFVPVEWVQPIAMTVEEAMRSSMFAWMARPPSSADNAPRP
jgi:uncharacterized membrane protein